MSNQSERNLLVGFLALQLDFIRREQFLAGMNAWIADKSQSLADILQAQGALTASVRPLLDQLVVQHLALHQNDPEKSLAALSRAGSVRAEIAKLGDDEIERSVALVGKDRDEDDEFRTRTFVGQSTSQGTRFRILRPHAKGGLGEVFVAEDGEIRREVALKQIQPDYADNQESRGRFLLEAEITGGLEHPGIVPVYGLGTYADGRPFYAMRFIRGDSLHSALKRFHAPNEKLRPDRLHLDRSERMLEFRQLLGRFIDVCKAIAYAHSRGVLHRDLKPGNIMLGKYGETLVVDWGLAKPLGVDELPTSLEPNGLLKGGDNHGSAPTAMGSALGTPAYMSPEQAAGKINLLAPVSDVYCLGATLYPLLTGQPPQTGKDVGEVLQNVQRGEFPRPRTLKHDIPAPLEAICLKAMSLAPADRYLDAATLAHEVEQWLAGEPVDAYRESFVERAGGGRGSIKRSSRPRGPRPGWPCYFYRCLQSWLRNRIGAWPWQKSSPTKMPSWRKSGAS